LVSSGEFVEQGTPILELSPERTQAEVEAALSNVQAAREARNNAQAELQALQAEQASAAADVELQKEEFRRAKFLVSQGAQSQQQLDQARRNLEAAQATLNSAQQRVQAARSRLEQANATLAQAQANAQAARGFRR
jgi:multidrug resistance efflux pump